jgi:hypothetical protein
MGGEKAVLIPDLWRDIFSANSTNFHFFETFFNFRGDKVPFSVPTSEGSFKKNRPKIKITCNTMVRVKTTKTKILVLCKTTKFQFFEKSFRKSRFFGPSKCLPSEGIKN